jgi:hypothetical protein
MQERVPLYSMRIPLGAPHESGRIGAVHLHDLHLPAMVHSAIRPQDATSAASGRRCIELRHELYVRFVLPELRVGVIDKYERNPPLHALREGLLAVRVRILQLQTVKVVPSSNTIDEKVVC